jgi:hypothetical protein
MLIKKPNIARFEDVLIPFAFENPSARIPYSQWKPLTVEHSMILLFKIEVFFEQFLHLISQIVGTQTSLRRSQIVHSRCD